MSRFDLVIIRISGILREAGCLIIGHPGDVVRVQIISRVVSVSFGRADCRNLEGAGRILDLLPGDLGEARQREDLPQPEGLPQSESLAGGAVDNVGLLLMFVLVGHG